MTCCLMGHAQWNGQKKSKQAWKIFTKSDAWLCHINNMLHDVSSNYALSFRMIQDQELKKGLKDSIEQNISTHLLKQIFIVRNQSLMKLILYLERLVIDTVTSVSYMHVHYSHVLYIMHNNIRIYVPA